MSYHSIDTLLSELYSLRRDEIKLGLEHTIKLLDTCGNPQTHFKSIHIAGTNGKGSTGKMMASILQESRLNIGHYSSPHLIRFNERIQVNNQEIPNQYILDFMNQYGSDIIEIQATYFETITAMAFCYFRDKKIDVAIIETGLGGRLDSTNVIQPDLVVMTPISLDHREILGDTIRQIAEEKAGIIKEFVPIIISPQKKEAMDVLFSHCDEKKITPKVVDFDRLDSTEITKEGSQFKFKDQAFSISIVGDFQIENAVLAIEASRLFLPQLKYSTIRDGLSRCSWPGRLQMVSKEKNIYYDVSHNAEGIEKTLKNIKSIFKGDIYGIVALKDDKELELISVSISDHFKALYVTSDKNGLLMERNALAFELNTYGVNCESQPSIFDAVDRCINYLKSEDVLLIFGSHYIAVDVYTYFQIPFDKY